MNEGRLSGGRQALDFGPSDAVGGGVEMAQTSLEILGRTRDRFTYLFSYFFWFWFWFWLLEHCCSIAKPTIV